MAITRGSRTEQVLNILEWKYKAIASKEGFQRQWLDDVKNLVEISNNEERKRIAENWDEWRQIMNANFWTDDSRWWLWIKFCLNCCISIILSSLFFCIFHLVGSESNRHQTSMKTHLVRIVTPSMLKFYKRLKSSLKTDCLIVWRLYLLLPVDGSVIFRFNTQMLEIFCAVD